MIRTINVEIGTGGSTPSSPSVTRATGERQRKVIYF